MERGVSPDIWLQLGVPNLPSIWPDKAVSLPRAQDGNWLQGDQDSDFLNAGLPTSSHNPAGPCMP